MCVTAEDFLPLPVLVIMIILSTKCGNLPSGVPDSSKNLIEVLTLPNPIQDYKKGLEWGCTLN